MDITRNVYSGEIANGKVMPTITTHTVTENAIATAQKAFEKLSLNANTL